MDTNTPVTVLPKSIWQSKTFWWSVIKGAASLITIILAANPTLKDVGIIALISQGLNILLRFSTASPIA